MNRHPVLRFAHFYAPNKVQRRLFIRFYETCAHFDAIYQQPPLLAALTKENIRHLLPPLHLIVLMFTLKHNMRRGNLRLRARKLISSEWKSTVTIR